MAFQGNLRDFSVTEILQLLGTQKKTGCLVLEWSTARAAFWVIDGRLVSTRQPGMSLDDPLLRFLLKVHGLSQEQFRGIETIQRESNRDLEDLLVNGRYLDGEELGIFVERQILDDLMRVTAWEHGSYRFDPLMRWPNPPLVRLGVEASLMEVARRADEQKRFEPLTQDAQRLVGVRDLPDTEDPLSEEESELFGIIDGRHTLAEIVQAAPLSEYEAWEALQRMLDASWIELLGRREADPAAAPAATEPALPQSARGRQEAPAEKIVRMRASLGRELVMAGAMAALAFVLAWSARALSPSGAAPGDTVFAAAHERDVRYALELYRRERGVYPHQLEELVQDRWIAREQTRVGGKTLVYRPDTEHRAYRLERAAP